MAVRNIRICDECGDATYPHKNYSTPKNWFRFVHAKLLYRKTNRKQTITDKNILEFDECEDPDFCSKSCLLVWFGKEVDKIK